MKASPVESYDRPDDCWGEKSWECTLHCLRNAAMRKVQIGQPLGAVRVCRAQIEEAMAKVPADLFVDVRARMLGSNPLFLIAEEALCDLYERTK